MNAAASASAQPPLQLFMRENNCTSALFLPSYGPFLHLSVLDALQKLEDVQSYETFCATKIQAVYRMHRQRKQYKNTLHAVVSIQRQFHTHLANKFIYRSMKEEMNCLESACFHYYATRIQAIFRGFYSRKYVDDYYARREYIREVAVRSDEVKADADQKREADDKRDSEAQQEHVASLYREATEAVHFMLSTVGANGVYRRFTSSPRGMTSQFNTNVEDDIRRNAQLARREERARQLAQAKEKRNQKEKKKQEDSLPTETMESSSSKQLGSPPADGKGKVLGVVSADPPPIDNAAEGVSETPARSEEKPSRALSRGCGLAKLNPTDRNGGGNAVSGTSGSKLVGPHQISPSVGPSCSWERIDVLPPQRPMIDASSCCRKEKVEPRKARLAQTCKPQSHGDASGPPKYTSESSFSPAFTVPKHDCLLPPMKNTYDTEAAALQKSVDRQYMQTLHHNQVFKV